MTRVLAFTSFATIAALLVACGEAPGRDDVPPDGHVVDPDPDGGMTAADDCPPMYQQNILPEYQLTIAPNEWAAMQDEFLHRPEREAAGLDPKPYHPASFHYRASGQTEVDVPQVMVRLKGASSWLQTIMFDEHPKMQFVISFNETDPDGRFFGVRKLELDMPRTDQTFMRQRLALQALRELGVPAQCANNVKLTINGQYYGLYTNLERFDKELIQRIYGHDADDGDLWETGRIIQTNETTFTWDRLDAFWHATTMADLERIADLDASIREWAGEMMVGDVDGNANGYANFMLYDHPTRGFIWMPQDLDTAFDEDFMPAATSPVFSPSPWRWERDWDPYRVVMLDNPDGFERFVTALGSVRARYHPQALQDDWDAWAAQIADAVRTDPHRPFTLDANALALARSRSYIADRAVAIDAWLACRRSGGPDADGDGHDLCHDCDDHIGAVFPGAAETCNMRDEDCDGRLDDPEETVCGAMP